MGGGVTFGDPVLEEAFWSRVEVDETTGCWLWIGGQKGRKGEVNYGLFRGKRAHRIALLGFDPDGYFPGAWALHRCDNPPCVNPEHLRWGTPAQNTQDMLERGRSSHPGHYRTDETCANGHSYSETPAYVYRGARLCRVCRRDSHNRWRETSQGRTIPEHGLKAYRYGCRCDVCRAEKAADSRERTTRLASNITRHGVTSSYTKGCRCDDCREAKSAKDAESYARRKARRGKL